MKTCRKLFSAIGAALAPLFLISVLTTSASAAGADTAQMIAQTRVVVASDTRNVPRCEGIEWSRVSSSEIRIWAPASVIDDYLYDPIEYGLVWVTVTAPNGTLRHQGTYNASVYGGTDFTVPAVRGDSVGISLTDDDNTITFCRGSDLV